VAAKFDWGDGRKVHSRKATPKERRRNKASRKKGGGGGSGGDSGISLYDAISAAAEGMANSQFAPTIRADKAAVADAKAQDPKIDKAYDRYNADSRGAQAQITAATDAASSHTAAAQGLATGQVAALGQEQVAQANAAASAYGQTADAAKIAANRQGDAAAQLVARGSSVAGLQGVLGGIQNQRLAQTIDATNVRRGEAHTESARELQARRDKLSGHRADRAAKAGELAQSLLKEERNYELAQDTLGARTADSKRDYKIALKTIAANNRKTDIADENADADRTSREKTDASDPATDLKRQQDLADDGKINGSTGGPKSGAKSGAYGTGASYKAGRDGRSTDISPSKLTTLKTKANKIRSLRDRGRQLVHSGDRNPEKTLRKQGLKGQHLALALTGVTGKIPRSLITYLAAELGVDRNDLPQDIAKAIERVPGSHIPKSKK
jgi:hypothetical protein